MMVSADIEHLADAKTVEELLSHASCFGKLPRSGFCAKHGIEAESNARLSAFRGFFGMELALSQALAYGTLGF